MKIIKIALNRAWKKSPDAAGKLNQLMSAAAASGWHSEKNYEEDNGTMRR
jgi:hypothetical protein